MFSIHIRRFFTVSKSEVFLTAVFVFWLILNTDSATYWVTPTGTSGNSGSDFTEAIDYTTAFSRAGEGDTVLLQGGVYTVPFTSSEKNTLTLSKSGSSGKPICVIADENSRAVFNFSYPDNSKVVNEKVTSYGFYITGSYWYFRGINITKAGYQGAYVTGAHITFENCSFYENWNTGLELNKGGSNITVINCDSYRNFDSSYKNGGMADGFASKQTQGAGNRFIGCRAWENSDDGYDTYDSPEAVVFDRCWAFRNGVNVWKFNGFEGNGNGFKVGGNDKLQNNVLTRCIAFGQPKKGFDQNNNTGGCTLYNCVSYANGDNYGFGGTLASGQKHEFSNNVSLSGSATVKNASQKNNTWNSGFSVSADDFLSIDTSLAVLERNPDGSLQESDLFRPRRSGELVDRGVDVGLPYNGSAPDIGCFESVTVGLHGGKRQGEQRVSGLRVLVHGDRLEFRYGSVGKAGIFEIFSCRGESVLRKSVGSGWSIFLNASVLAPGAYLAVLSFSGLPANAARFIR